MNAPDVVAADRAIAASLPVGSLYAVGGRVRDEVRTSLDGIARPAKDLDYVATGIELDELVERLARLGRADVVGASFAVVKCTFDGTTVDVALPRREHSTGVGHRDFVVEAGPAISIEEDLARRDFRMNMLARAIPAGAIVDPYGGEADIRARRVDLLRPEAFEEDPLRMLRAAQFAARFEYEVTPSTMAAMRKAAPLIETVSADRVHDELVKLLDEAPRPSIGFEVMREGGLLEHVLPEISEGIGVAQNEYHAYDVYHHTLATLDAVPPGNLAVRLGALLHDVGKPRTKEGPHFYRHEIVGEELTRLILGRLRFSNELIERVARLVRHHMYRADPEQADATLRRFVGRIGADRLADQFALRAADAIGSGLPIRGNNEVFEARVQAVMAQEPALTVKDLAIGGADVIRAAIEAGILSEGSQGGPIVGEVLRHLLEGVIDRPESNEPAILKAETKAFLDRREARQ
jgi:tRNA nucleotidyltransferase (CCA-adding enzyme)